MQAIGRMIVTTIETRDDPSSQAKLQAEVAALAARFPGPGMAAG
jgi:hypothetical protein